MGKYDNNAAKASATKFANSPAKMQTRLNEKFGGHITIHSGYKGFRFPATFHCSKHNVIFDVPRAEAMIHDRVGCPTCSRESKAHLTQKAGTSYSTNSYAKAVRAKFGRKITVVGEYGGYEARRVNGFKTEHRCSKHGIFEAWPMLVLNSSVGGCPDCGKYVRGRLGRITQAEFRRQLKIKNPSVRHIGKYVNRTTSTDFMCRECSYSWSTVPEAVLRDKPTGCNACFIANSKYNWLKGSTKREYQLGRRKVMLQGYEPQALDYLLSVGYKPAQIRVGKEVPRIRYFHEGKWRWYYPDFWIPHQNLIVEVKSVYFFGVSDINIFRTVKAKRAATLEHHNFSLLVMSEDGTKVSVPQGWHNLPHDKLKAAMR